MARLNLLDMALIRKPTVLPFLARRRDTLLVPYLGLRYEQRESVSDAMPSH